MAPLSASWPRPQPLVRTMLATYIPKIHLGETVVTTGSASPRSIQSFFALSLISLRGRKSWPSVASSVPAHPSRRRSATPEPSFRVTLSLSLVVPGKARRDPDIVYVWRPAHDPGAATITRLGPSAPTSPTRPSRPCGTWRPHFPRPAPLWRMSFGFDTSSRTGSSSRGRGPP